ncbi:MAG: esterase family protein, partial [Ruminococcaceae bacterium]|nr:esterase family protein [Oscillospiraceae bacterium]
MNMKKIGKAAVLFASILFLTACSPDTSTPETDSSAISAPEESPASTETASEISEPETEEIPYMEKYKDIIEEMPREGITEKRDDAVYPEFQRLTYYSATAERDTPVNVLLPQNYSEEKSYPVLYVLHGYYDNEGWMARDIVGISAMLTNLCADGDAEEMIVVLPYIYCSKDMPYCTGMDLQNSLNYDNFINDLTADLMPFIESSFSVAKGRENTAITGFSMGGRESLFIGFSHPELFGYIGAVCPAPGLTPVSGSGMHPGQMEEYEMTFEDNAPFALLISAAKNDGVVGSFPSN